jgi:Kef-type K+ transport system membrane component KefB
MTLLLGQLIVVLGAALLCGRLARALGQPAVIGEMTAGLLLGPSVLGWAWPGASALLFPPDSLSGLTLLSQIGILLFLFGVGLDLDFGALRKKARTAILVSQAGILLPFALGAAVSPFLHGTYGSGGVGLLPFALFMGVAMSITAFPVLARILEDRGLLGTSLGTTAMASAAVDDVSAWTLLALVIAVAGHHSPLAALGVASMAAAFALAMLFVVRPFLARRWPAGGETGLPGKTLAACILIGVFLSALATEAIGVHALFGAFLAGAVLPSRPGLKAFLKDRLEYSASLYLLPVFFAATGLRTSLGLLDRPADWLVFLLLLAIAIAGKFGGASLAARFTGASWRESLSLGALMNTRGLMELIVLNIGLDLGILSPRIFSMMVLMALVTTAMTGPLLSWFLGDRRKAD